MNNQTRSCVNSLTVFHRASTVLPWLALTAALLSVLGTLSVARASPVTDWNTLASDLAAANQDPANQTYTLAIVQIAVHDALNAIHREYDPYAYRGSAPGASAAAAVATAARDTLLQRIPAAAETIEASYAAALAAVSDAPGKDAGISAGQQAAAAILNLRRSDDLPAALVKPYTPGDPAPGVYQLIPPLNFVLLAGVGEVAPFALQTGSQFRSREPLPIDSCDYATDYDEVMSLGSAKSIARTAEQTQTANFWYDVATKEWHRAAQAGLADVSADEWQSARVLALLSMAMFDGTIASADTKFAYDYWRPITAIRNGAVDGNAATRGDSSWEPLCVTPPFPEYNSTHAVTAAAAATVLAQELGDEHRFSVSSPTLLGVSREYDRFSRAAHDEAVSRIYCGIHFRGAMDAGLEQGESVARHVLGSKLRPWRSD